MRSRWNIAALALIALAAIGAPPRARAQEDAAMLAKENNRFAIELSRELGKRPGNLFFSPQSISTAMAMAYAGAQGDTAAEIAAALHFPNPPGGMHAAFGKSTFVLNDIQKLGHAKLAIANSIWPDKSYTMLPAYLDLLKSKYGAELTPLDFAGSTEQSRAAINAWVEKMTNDKIKELLKPGMVGPLTRMVLVNAIWFKGDWAVPFESTMTQPAPFQLGAGKTVDVPLMNKVSQFGYSETDDLQAVSLPYAGNELSMVVLLPKKADGLKTLEESLTADKLTTWTANMIEQKVNVFLPKFKMTGGFKLKETLQALGVRDAFIDKAADFSGMDGSKSLYISEVIHKAFVDVNEEGTEAAAATAIIMAPTGMAKTPAAFRADHPFLFLIRENKSGAILFMGRVADPTDAGD